MCRGGFSSDFGSGVSCSLNRCCTWPCVVGACHNSGAAARTDSCWQAVMQAGGLREEQGKPAVSPALQGLRGAEGTRQALQHCPRLILLCCSLPVPRSADTRLWGSVGIAKDEGIARVGCCSCTGTAHLCWLPRSQMFKIISRSCLVKLTRGTVLGWGEHWKYNW